MINDHRFKEGLARDQFLTDLHKILHPTAPINSVEYLYGRDEFIDGAREALYAHGRHCFIYGDRGVGKSSLAFTLAGMIQSSERDYIRVNCSTSSTFESILKVIVRAISVAVGNNIEITQTTSTKVTLKFIEYNESQSEKSIDSVYDYSDVTESAYLLSIICPAYSEKTVIVIDEFDTIADVSQKEKFGELVKHLSNLECSFKLIFTGIAKSMIDLMGGHSSSVRQVYQVHLPPLSWDGRFEIIDIAFKYFDIEIPDEIRFKIAGMSDGFPSYIHLLCEELLKLANKRSLKKISFNIFIEGLDKAISSIGEHIRSDYDKATTCSNDESYHHLIWSIADSSDLIRNKESIKTSYDGVAKQLHIEPLEQKKWNAIFSSLRGEKCGNIIIYDSPVNKKYYKFKESMVRGFVRMIAEKYGVNLDFEKSHSASRISVSSSKASRTYYPLNSIERQVEDWREDEKKER